MFALEELLLEHSGAWLWTCGASAFTILMCLVHHTLCYSINIMETRDNGSQFTSHVETSFPIFWNHDELSYMAVKWECWAAFSLVHVCWRREFQPQTSEETCQPICRALTCVQGVFAVWLLRCSPAAWEELGPLFFRFVSCFPLGVDTTARTPDLITGI